MKYQEDHQLHMTQAHQSATRRSWFHIRRRQWHDIRSGRCWRLGGLSKVGDVGRRLDIRQQWRMWKVVDPLKLMMLLPSWKKLCDWQLFSFFLCQQCKTETACDKSAHARILRHGISLAAKQLKFFKVNIYSLYLWFCLQDEVDFSFLL